MTGVGAGVTAAGLGFADRAGAFARAGAFHPRLLSTGGSRPDAIRSSAAERWAWELERRTSAPAKLLPQVVPADDPALLDEPFLLWGGDHEVAPLSTAERRGLSQHLGLGGVLIVDDWEPTKGNFRRSAERELAQVVPESPVIRLEDDHVIFKTYYIITNPVGRLEGKSYLEAIVRGGVAQVVFLSHDLMGALTRTRGGGWAMGVTPGGFRQREYAVRLAVNLAMYVLCSDYKDDQVHAPWLMRRGARRRP